MSDQPPPTADVKTRAVMLGQALLIVLFVVLCGWAIHHFVVSSDGSRREGPAVVNAPGQPRQGRPIAAKNTTANVVNLSVGLDIEKATVSGKWTLTEGSFVSDMLAATRLDLGYCPPGEYDLQFTFSRLSGNDGIDTILCFGGRQFIWTMAGWNNTVCGFCEVSARPADDNPTTVKGQWFKNGQRYTCVVKVRSDRVQAFLDDRLISEWPTDYDDLATSSRPLHRTDTLGLSTWESSYAIHSVSITEIAGKGTRISPADPQDATPIAVWNYAVADRAPVSHVMFSNGHMKSPDGAELWFLRGDHLTFRWGDWVDDCKLAPDRRSFAGTNRSGEKIEGEIISGGL